MVISLNALAQPVTLHISPIFHHPLCGAAHMLGDCLLGELCLNPFTCQLFKLFILITNQIYHNNSSLRVKKCSVFASVLQRLAEFTLAKR